MKCKIKGTSIGRVYFYHYGCPCNQFKRLYVKNKTVVKVIIQRRGHIVCLINALLFFKVLKKFNLNIYFKIRVSQNGSLYFHMMSIFRD